MRNYGNRASLAALAAAGITGPGLALETKDAGGNGGGEGGNAGPEVKAALEELGRTAKEHRDAVDAEIKAIKEKGSADPLLVERVGKLDTALTDMGKKLDALRLADARPETRDAYGEKRAMTDAEVKFRDAARSYMRKGDEGGYDLAEVKALTAGTDPDGGFMITPEMDRNISRIVSEASPIRSVANVVSIQTSAYKRLINVGGTGSGWVGETSARPQTDTASLRERTYPVMELYANPAVTQTLLDDAMFNVEAWLADEVQIEFAEQEGAAFIMGDGVSKPRGFIGGYAPVADAAFSEAVGAPGFIKTGANGAFLSTSDGDEENNLIDLVTALKASYRSNARFVMNRATVGMVRKFRDADGRSFWNQSTVAGQPSTLLGYPVLEAEDMPAVEADSFSVAFGDFNRGYQIVDRFGTRILRDPYTAKPFVLFYTTKRVGGGIRMAEAIKLLKFAA
jgi:HK97 family phage major capsid protein